MLIVDVIIISCFHRSFECSLNAPIHHSIYTIAQNGMARIKSHWSVTAPSSSSLIYDLYSNSVLYEQVNGSGKTHPMRCGTATQRCAPEFFVLPHVLFALSAIPQPQTQCTHIIDHPHATLCGSHRMPFLDYQACCCSGSPSNINVLLNLTWLMSKH